MTVALRPLDWPGDRAALRALDTSYETDHVFVLEIARRSVALRERALAAPIRGAYPFADEVDALPGYAWVRVAHEGDALVGVAAVATERWNRRARLEHLYVAPSARARGVGSALVDGALDAARELGARGLWVETQPANAGAIRFYERSGFVWCGLDTSLYDPEAAPGEEAGVFFWRPV